MSESTCPLCEREVPTTSGHHLIPKSKGGREQTEICTDCHRMIHTRFTNRELNDTYYTVEAIRSDPAFARYLRWIRKRPATTSFKAQKPYGARRFTRCRKRIEA